MKRKIAWVTIGILILLSMIMASCASSTSSTSTTSTSTPPPTGTASGPPPAVTTTSAPPTTAATTANWWDKLGTPVYGGSLTFQTSSLDYLNLDPAIPGPNTGVTYETLFAPSWTLNRSVTPLSSSYVAPQNEQGLLAESWEQTNPTTVVVKLRQGVHWQNKPPVNGREFTADDVVYNFDRLLGTGDGFSAPNPFFSGMIPYLKSATALDKYTVQFTLKSASALAIYDVFAPQAQIVSPEWVKQYGSTTFSMPGPPGGGPANSSTTTSGVSSNPPANGSSTTGITQGSDWHTYASTGPYTVTDFVPGSSVTDTKNADYYGHDERYPQNRLPYIDTMTWIAIPDMSTAEAALRTGKIDFVGGGGKGNPTFSWQDIKSLKQEIPGLQVWYLPVEGESLSMRVDKSPFTDISVRKALQMAIDRKTIAATHFGGIVNGTPCGLVSPTETGWYVPYAQWPADLQQNYSYNPTQAKQLLSEAGYPNGFDTDVVAASNDDIDLLQIIQAEFKDIGVNMKITTMDQFTEMNYVGGGKEDQMSAGQFTGAPIDPWQAISVMRTGDRQNATFNNDAKFDAMYQSILNAPTQEDAMKLTQQADIYFLQQNWMIQTFPNATATVALSQVKGYVGEDNPNMFNFSRWWIGK